MEEKMINKQINIEVLNLNEEKIEVEYDSIYDVTKVVHYNFDKLNPWRIKKKMIKGDVREKIKDFQKRGLSIL